MTTASDVAREKGRRAATNLVEPHCPYRPGTTERADWLAGVADATTELHQEAHRRAPRAPAAPASPPAMPTTGSAAPPPTPTTAGEPPAAPAA